MYPEYPLPPTSIKLSENPIDDYQRTWLAAGDVRSDTHGWQGQPSLLRVTRTRYRTCAVQGFHDVLAGGGAAAKRVGLECSEYQFPDVLDMGSANGHAQQQPQQQQQPRAPAQVFLAPHTHELNSLTKNQQFRLRKIQYSDQRVSRAINPNNCVLWDHQTGYVFFTGIWRLYQDVMQALVSLDRPDTTAGSVDRKAHCQLELDYVLSKCFYECAQPVESPLHFSRRKSSAKRGVHRHASVPNVSTSAASSSQSRTHHAAATSTASGAPSSSLHYADIHWHNLDPQLKQSLCRVYRETYHLDRDVEFQDLMKRIRGGYIKIQGTWLPFELARALCVRFCYPIRYLLVPIFGPSFPDDCVAWYEHYIGLYPPKTVSERATAAQHPIYSLPSVHHRSRPPKLDLSVSRPVKRPKVDVELLDASQNLLRLSRDNISPPDLPAQSQMAVAPFFRDRAASWAPELSSPNYSTHSSYQSQNLPPIRPLLDSLERNYSPSSKPTTTNFNSNAEYFSSPLSGDTSYSSPPISPGYSTIAEAPKAYGASPVHNGDMNFVTTPPVSGAFSSVAMSPYSNPPTAGDQPAHHPINPMALNNIAHFYNSHGHKYTYPGGMQVMYRPQNSASTVEQQHPQQSKSSGKENYCSIDV
ncbi:LADA_0E10704g1_1 [Lachancea dasiensis]|uniref:LADA_0E10704g1_1 n=1 Tax=Lachancea dasiensis TaxID=1072105 RepID=A0A1G4JEX8_9SACH|nr:LADA_0E10704g1_1 [Lachancea dasiensis]